MKKALIIIFSILGVFVLIGAGGIFYMTNGLESGASMPISPVDLAKIDDGTYPGIYNGGRWTNEVEVIVADHQIAQINVLKTVGIETPDVTNAIINSVIQKQNTTVNTVSGATVTSKAYLKAIKNALSQ